VADASPPEADWAVHVPALASGARESYVSHIERTGCRAVHYKDFSTHVGSRNFALCNGARFQRGWYKHCSTCLHTLQVAAILAPQESGGNMSDDGAGPVQGA